MKLSYIGNSGFYLEYKDQGLLIDGLYEPLVNEYPAVPEELVKKIQERAEPFQKLSSLMFTHAHLDHFSAAYVLPLLKDFVPMYATYAAVHKIAAIQPDFNYEAVCAYHAQKDMYSRQNFSLKGISGLSYKIPHSPPWRDAENLVLCFELGGKTFVHPGDMGINLRPLQTLDWPPKIDYFFAPEWMLIHSRRYCALRDLFKPENIIVMHVAKRHKERYPEFLCDEMKQDYPTYIHLKESLDSLVLDAD